MYQRKVLIVDDEPLIRMALSDALEDEGYAVLEACNVLEAVAVIGMHDIDALVTDVDMPGSLNGFDLMRLVSSYGSGIAVVVTSGGHKPDECEMAPGCCFLAKPYRMEDVMQLLESLARLTTRSTLPGRTG